MRKTTNKSKEKAGTIRKDRVRKITSVPGIPDPQPYLTPEGQAMYYAICKHLRDAKALHPIDSVFVSAAAHSAFLVGVYSKQVATEGAVQVFDTGATNVTGAYAVLKNERADFFRYAKELGLTPKSREQILAFSGAYNEDEDPVQSLIKAINTK